MVTSLLVYKKAKNCPSCKTLDLLTPTLKKKFPGLEWEYEVFDEENPDTKPPAFVRSFPTILLRDTNGDTITTVVGYESLAKTIHTHLNGGA